MAADAQIGKWKIWQNSTIKAPNCELRSKNIFDAIIHTNLLKIN